MKTFKKPLSPSQEKEYLEQYRLGDLTARNMLIEHNLRLVAHVARKYQVPEYDSEDLISIGIIGLVKAITTFDNEKNNRLATYAARCIENELLMMLRSRKKLTRETSIYEQIGIDQEGRELRIMDVLESEPVDLIEDLETRRKIRYLKKCLGDGILSKRERYVIWERYGLEERSEKTQREVAEELGISRSYVSRIEKRALLKLRQEFEKWENGDVVKRNIT